VSESKPLRAGIVGVGHMGRYHVGAYSELLNVQIVGVSDVNVERAKQVTEPFDLPYFSDHRDLFGKVDMVSVAVPTALHFPVAKEFLDNGIHVLLEKPIAPTMAEAEELFAIAAKNNLVLHIGHVERFNGAVQEMKKIVDSPYIVESKRIGPWTGRITDAGVVLDILIHDIDIVLNMIDRPIAKLDVQGRKIMSDYEDLVTVQITFDNGTLATFLASRVSEEKIRTLTVHQKGAYINLDYSYQEIHIHRSSQSSYTLTVADGALKYRQESIVERLFVHKGNPLKFELQHFLNCVQGNGDRMISVENELRSLKVSLEVLERLKAVE